MLNGIIIYLDPVDKGLTKLVGEIYYNGEIYLFFFNSDISLKKGDEVGFDLDEKGIAVLNI